MGKLTLRMTIKFLHLRALLGYLLLAVVAYVPLFYHLDQDSIRLWDESRIAVNAAEVLETDSWIVTTFDHQTDLWHTKPPLSVWLCAISMRLFGMNELAVRLPSAMAALALAWMLLWVGRNVLHNARAGWMMALAMLTMRGLIVAHVARTGDIDMLMVTTMAAFVLGLFTHVYGPEALRQRGLWFGATGLALALMAKASPALMLMPGLAIWLALDRKLLPLLRQGRTYLALGVAFAPLLLFYAIRESAKPGYLAATWANDYFGRLLTPIEGHQGPFYFYLELSFQDQLFPYVYALPWAVMLVLRQRDSLPARLAGLSLSTGLVFLLVISAASTKLEWYGAPALMLAAIVLGLGAEACLGNLLPHAPQRTWQAALLIALFGLAVFGQNYYAILRRNGNYARHRYVAERYGYAIEEIHRDHPLLEPYAVIVDGYNASAMFYAQKMKAEEQVVLPVHNARAYKAQAKDMVLSCDSLVSDSLKHVYQATVLWRSDYGCQVMRLMPLSAASPDSSLAPAEDLNLTTKIP